MIKPPLLRDAVGTVCHNHVVHGLLEGAVEALVACLVHHVASLRGWEMVLAKDTLSGLSFHIGKK